MNKKIWNYKTGISKYELKKRRAKKIRNKIRDILLEQFYLTSLT